MRIYVKNPSRFLGVILTTMFTIALYLAFNDMFFQTFKGFLTWLGIVAVFSAIFTYLTYVVKEE